jgi:NAD-dependent deacetylase
LFDVVDDRPFENRKAFVGAQRADGCEQDQTENMPPQGLPPSTPGLGDLALHCRGARIGVLTGAGISAPSGIETFRGAGGHWRHHRAEDLATPEGFARDPGLVWEWYGERREKLRRAAPNAAHRALVDLARHAESLRIITQNVDGLHAAADPAGEIELVELHGSIWRTRCTRCGDRRENHAVLPPAVGLPHCGCGGLMRPDVVWFGEHLPAAALHRAAAIARDCAVFLVVGTSGTVMPAASLAALASRDGARVVVFDLECGDDSARLCIRGDCAQSLPALVAAVATGAG